MATDEVENFVRKFKMLKDSGYDTTLTLESKLGEVFVTLNCKVGRTTPPPQTPPMLPSSPRYRSPSYFRRLARRKAAAESEKTVMDLKAEEVLVNNGDLNDDAADPPSNVYEEVLITAVKPSVTAGTVATSEGEVNAHQTNISADQSSTSGLCNEAFLENEEIDSHEVELDKLVDEVIVYAVPPSDIRKPIQDVKEVEAEVMERFAAIGSRVEDIRHRTNRGIYESSLVKIKPPINLKKIWGRRLGLQSCAVIEYKSAR